MFATCRAEERRTLAFLVAVYDEAGNGIVVKSYLLSPAPWQNCGTSDDIANEGACFEHRRDVPCDVIDGVLRFWNTFSPLAPLGQFPLNL